MTTRDYAQTLELLRLHGDRRTRSSGRATAGPARFGKARAMTGRLRALRRYARGRGFDLALSHASHELQLVARSLGIPSAYAFDYEFARVAARARLPRRAARRRPGGDPAGRGSTVSERGTRRCAATPGSRRSTTSPASSPIRPSSTSSASTASASSSSCARRPRSRSTTGTGTRCSPTCCERLGRRPGGPRGRPPSHRRAAGRDPDARPPLARRARARDRRAEPRRARRPRRLGRRDDEPRGGRARRSRLHDVSPGDSARSTTRLIHEGRLRVAELGRRARLEKRDGASTRADRARSGAAARPHAHGARGLARMCPDLVRVPHVRQGKGRDEKTQARRAAGAAPSPVGGRHGGRLRRRQRQRLQDSAAGDAHRCWPA